MSSTTLPASRARSVVDAFRGDPEIQALTSRGLSFDFSTRSERVTLDNIDVEEGARGLGIASAALRRLTALADESHVVLDLEVGSSDQSIDLVAWYGRHGFHWMDGFMARAPKGSFAKGYHVTTLDSLDAIRSSGLEPRIGPRSEELGEPEPAIYLFPSLEDVETALSNWLGEWFEDDVSLVVLEIDLLGVQATQATGQFEITTPEALAPHRILGVLDENLRPLRKTRPPLPR